MDRGLFGKELAGMALNFGIPMNSDRWDRRVDYLYDRLKSIDDATFKKACDQIGMRSLRFPALAEFLDAIQSATPIGWDPGKIIKETCTFCNNSGFLTATKEMEWRGQKTEVDYCFRCVCAIGKLRADDIPVWEKKWKSRGYSIKKWDLTGCKDDASRDLESMIEKIIEKTKVPSVVKEEAPF